MTSGTGVLISVLVLEAELSRSVCGVIARCFLLDDSSDNWANLAARFPRSLFFLGEANLFPKCKVGNWVLSPFLKCLLQRRECCRKSCSFKPILCSHCFLITGFEGNRNIFTVPSFCVVCLHRIQVLGIFQFLQIIKFIYT